jgi:hypothetical protein
MTRLILIKNKHTTINIYHKHQNSNLQNPNETDIDMDNYRTQQKKI